MKNTLVKTTRLARLIGYRTARPGEDGQQPILLAQGGSEDDAGGDDVGEYDDTMDDDAGDDADDTKKSVSQAEFDRVTIHLSNADRKQRVAEKKAQELEKEINALWTKDQPDAERAKA